MRARQGFVLDARSMLLIVPWRRKRPQPGDEARMDAMLAELEVDALPEPACWCWPDRPPEPVRDTPPGWLERWSRDRAVY
jgi:hypothetical protein